jgi:hypothetical protein
MVIIKKYQLSSLRELELLTSRIQRLVITQSMALQHSPLQRLPCIRAMRPMILPRRVDHRIDPLV